MRRVFAIGETILDIIFEGFRPVKANPGGSVLNSAVSIARAGFEVQLISEISDDKPAEIIESFLRENNVKCDNLVRMQHTHTPLALAFLNEQKEAHYEFYKDYPRKELKSDMPYFNHEDIVLFGSAYSALPEVRTNLKALLEKANKAGSLIIYDPNVRRPYVNKESYDFFKENMLASDLVRASLPDFSALGIKDNYFDIVKPYAPLLILTNGADNIFLYTTDFNRSFPVIETKVISSIGAGDSFNAGLICGLIENDVYKFNLPKLSQEKWVDIIGKALKFAKETVNSYDNYIPKGFKV